MYARNFCLLLQVFSALVLLERERERNGEERVFCFVCCRDLSQCMCASSPIGVCVAVFFFVHLSVDSLTFCRSSA